jgi:hypothetical protein
MDGAAGGAAGALPRGRGETFTNKESVGLMIVTPAIASLAVEVARGRACRRGRGGSAIVDGNMRSALRHCRRKQLGGGLSIVGSEVF